MRASAIVLAVALGAASAAHAAVSIAGEWSFTASFDWRPVAACSVTVTAQTGFAGTCDLAGDIYTFAMPRDGSDAPPGHEVGSD